MRLRAKRGDRRLPALMDCAGRRADTLRERLPALMDRAGRRADTLREWLPALMDRAGRRTDTLRERLLRSRGLRRCACRPRCCAIKPAWRIHRRGLRRCARSLERCAQELAWHRHGRARCCGHRLGLRRYWAPLRERAEIHGCHVSTRCCGLRLHRRPAIHRAIKHGRTRRSRLRRLAARSHGRTELRGTLRRP